MADDAQHKQTPSQTVGPYFAYGLTPRQYGYPLPGLVGPDLLGSEEVAGERIWLIGRVLDTQGAPVDDALIEIWQADAAGRLPSSADGVGNRPGFRGYGRCGTGTDPESRFVFRTLKPGAVAADAAPHISLVVFARGLLSHLYTRVYFADEAAANAADPVLAQVPAERRDTLIADRQDAADGPVYRMDIRLQGAGETVFFDL
ncbi:protocatechuate 3,4-dioxygenase subunit alpha [Rhodovibrio salinarum]|uniref:Protocatechuate 3,4-dioxygenase subunit alpha n=1 Tax=Rhodovibrio salinarum TaxID=1087 RepID=A0A934QIA4_9PROT|nr:protocatechuate 3,4-dioxygenase subunit alpha [Rhodovibrio salinarum]MBK1697546.1 protocatechuate 3,4-dioxygenase subunit alpha [Rhodovibrio salinarum]